ncbi:hypothetical protein H0B56_12115 [Haloechinothrix sp. YIM 98757]|uniref:Uncharacterized protein n=1 Tax=Haloechinothrix aidingensis TaxID=2752311 RepID=A0A838AAN7_9PSEU|nr:hypothetical protein [Haloechinothrix aidingensis]MBA0126287.1 hypothetical protein [Haloechinothrix aidingensis]
MRITMKALCALPERTLAPGRTYQVADDRAQRLIARGYAVDAGDDPAERAGQTEQTEQSPAPSRRSRKTSRRKSTGEAEGDAETADGADGDASTGEGDEQ